MKSSWETHRETSESTRHCGSDRSMLPKLGIGVLFNSALPGFLQSDLDLVDYVAIIPDTFWIDHGPDQPCRYDEFEAKIELLDWLVERRPIVAHSVGLSIGSATLFDTGYVEQIARWHARYAFPWHSDHLSFTRVGSMVGEEFHAGLAIPVPYDVEVLELISRRVDYIQRLIPAPFLLENNVYYVTIPNQDMSEPEFLNALAARTGCGLLLDLHNVYTNARNHGFNTVDFISQLDLSRVVEIHIAGGEEFDDMYTDAHAGPCPDEVWELLDWVMARASNVCAVTFEFHESYYARLLREGVVHQLCEARSIWDRYH